MHDFSVLKSCWAMCVFSVFFQKSVLKSVFERCGAFQFSVWSLFMRNVWLFRLKISVLKSSWAMFAVAGLVWRVCVTQVTAMERTDNCNCAPHVQSSYQFSLFLQFAEWGIAQEYDTIRLGSDWIWFLLNFQTEELKRFRIIMIIQIFWIYRARRPSKLHCVINFKNLATWPLYQG